MTRAELSVVTYTPVENSIAHWAIHLCIIDGDTTQNFIYQAIGESGNLGLNVIESNPKASRRFDKQISIAEIDDEDTISEVEDILRQQPMKNDISSWNCQDWVLEALEALDEEGHLSDAYQYQEGRTTLMDFYYTN